MGREMVGTWAVPKYRLTALRFPSALRLRLNCKNAVEFEGNLLFRRQVLSR